MPQRRGVVFCNKMFSCLSDFHGFIGAGGLELQHSRAVETLPLAPGMLGVHADPVRIAEGCGQARRRAHSHRHNAEELGLKEFDLGFHKPELKLVSLNGSQGCTERYTPWPGGGKMSQNSSRPEAGAVYGPLAVQGPLTPGARCDR